MAAVATTNFADRLAEAVERKRSQLVVGLDPRPDLLPVELKGDAHLGREQAAEACGRFCRGLVDAVAPYVVAVKPQVAFFEALGPDGLRVLEDVCAYSRSAGLQVIADGKRGDVPHTAAAYAACIVTFVSATKLTTAANAIFLQYTAPVWVLVYMVARGVQRATASRVLSVGLAVVGSALAIVAVAAVFYSIRTTFGPTDGPDRLR